MKTELVKRAADDAGETVAAAGEKDDYNPQCLPLEYFDKIQSEKEARAKRDEKAVAVPAEETKDGAEDEIVAQPGYFVPARRHRPCFGRGRNFTKDCGPGPRV
uniref:Uncharacterized protein n=1 Tax=Anopheles quadriannulatus TaxID=34691 RepID=A0A182WWD8_ANOQN